MGYIINSVQVISLLIVNILQAFAITTRFDHDISSTRNFRRHIGGTISFLDWELGLREAVFQALLRERNLHPHLREYLLSAPIIGRQDTATPFGDIAIVARGQLYSAPGGFQFVQDPYQNDCDGCHNAPPRCDRVSCENWKPEGHERLLALWTVKRIRHRDSNYGYRYELEYKITPMNVAANEHFITRNGRFDYSVPGHTFIVKAGSRQPEHTFERINSISDNKVYRSSSTHNSNHFGPNFDAHYLPPPPPPPTEEEYYDNDPRNVGYPSVLYGPPELYTRRPPYSQFTTKKYPQPYNSEEEPELFNTFFDPTTKKTTTSTSTTTQSSVFDIFENTQPSPPLFTPVMTTKTSPGPTFPTAVESTSKTTQRDVTHQTSSQIPILPTIPIQVFSVRTTDIAKDTSTTINTEENSSPTKPLFMPSTIRFPTVTPSKSTTPLFSTSTTKNTPTTRFSEKSSTVKYSEPDPLYSSQTTQSTQIYSTRITKQYKPTTTKFKTTESDDYDIFGDSKTFNMMKEGPNTIKFPGDTNVRTSPGEQVITVVDAPTITTKQQQEQKSTLPTTKFIQSTMINPTYQMNFDNTQLLSPTNETYVTISLKPSTRDQHLSSPGVVSNTESSIPYVTTNNAILSEATLSQASSKNYAGLTTTRYTTRNHITPEHITIIPITKTTSRSIRPTFQNKPFIRTTIRRTTTPLTTTSPIAYITSPTSFHSSLRTSTASTVNYYLPRTSTTTGIVTKTTLSPFTTSTRSITLPTKRRTSSINLPSTTRKLYSTLRPLTLRTRPTQSKMPINIDRGTTENLSTISSTSIAYDSTTFNLTTTSFPTTDFSPTSMRDLDTTTLLNTESTSKIESSSTESTGILKTTSSEVTVSTDLSTVMTTTSKLDLLNSSTMLTIPPQTTTMMPESSTTIISTSTTAAAVVLETNTTEITTLMNNQLTITKTTATKPTLKLPSPTKPTATNDFLSENGISSKSPTIKQGENFEYDIFGEPQDKKVKKPTTKKQNKPEFNSKEIDDIFGDSEKTKSQKHNENNVESSTLSTSTLKIIYSNFYSPSAISTTAINDNDVNHSAVTTIKDIDNPSEKTTEYKPLTSQSFSTSVSFEVNKKNKTAIEKDFLDIDYEIKSEDEALIENPPENIKHRRPTRIPCNNITEKDIANDKRLLDDLTLSVVNHAKSIDILHTNNDPNDNEDHPQNNDKDNNSNNNKERKYKRKRTYKAQRLHRRT